MTGSKISNPLTNVNLGTLETTRDLAAAAGAVDYTGFGFDPALVIIFAIQNGGDNRISIGYFDGTTDNNIYKEGSAVWKYSGDFIKAYIGAGSGQYGSASFISDGVRITWVKDGTPTGTYNLFIIAFA